MRVKLGVVSQADRGPAARVPQPGPRAVALSNSSVFPESSAACFEVAAELGFDGVEIMIGADRISTDIETIARLSEQHRVPVVSIHAPTLLATQNVWGIDPFGKLRRSGVLARRLGAGVVVVHPPFRWQGSYAARFVDTVRQLNADFAPVKFAVENMYPWASKVRGIPAYLPGWDPTSHDFDHLTLDLSHASIAHVKSIDYVRAWGPRLTHVHLTDGSGKQTDEHLFPGRGDQDAWGVVHEAVGSGYQGAFVLELNCRKVRSKQERRRALDEVLQQTRAEIEQALSG